MWKGEGNIGRRAGTRKYQRVRSDSGKRMEVTNQLDTARISNICAPSKRGREKWGRTLTPGEE